jgi:cytochrome c551/c552
MWPDNDWITAPARLPEGPSGDHRPTGTGTGRSPRGARTAWRPADGARRVRPVRRRRSAGVGNVVRLRAAAVSLAAAVAIGVVAGCGGASSDEASTPANAPTVANTALQTDSNGKTVSAPSETAGGGGGGGATTGTGGGGGGAAAGDAAAGKTVFEQQGCGSCHTYSKAGSNGKVGPDLDAGLKGKDAAYIKQSITDPNAVVAPGFQPGIMPQNYGKSLSATQINDLVAFLQPQG